LHLRTAKREAAKETVAAAATIVAVFEFETGILLISWSSIKRLRFP